LNNSVGADLKHPTFVTTKEANIRDPLPAVFTSHPHNLFHMNLISKCLPAETEGPALLKQKRDI
jgi:hypothetical protein